MRGGKLRVVRPWGPGLRWDELACSREGFQDNSRLFLLSLRFQDDGELSAVGVVDAPGDIAKNLLDVQARSTDFAFQ